MCDNNKKQDTGIHHYDHKGQHIFVPEKDYPGTNKSPIVIPKTKDPAKKIA
jgi:hypothetical protein